MLRTVALCVGTLAVSFCLTTPAFADDSAAGTPQRLAGLREPARITVDDEGISHVRASNEHDLYFMQGWVHAGDRLFQMDYNRRLASGTLAEVVGMAALANDVQLRTLGLRRGAQRSYDAGSPHLRAAVEAYAEGVNAWLAAQTSLPPEYGALKLKGVAPWTPVDSIVIGKLLAFSLAFELDITRTVALQSYMAVFGAVSGVALYEQDLWRSAAFEPNATIPDAMIAAPHAATRNNERRGMERAHEAVHGEEHIKLMRDYLERVRDIPVFRGILNAEARGSSNLWAVSGSLTADGRPLIANDPHLALPTPSTFYPMGLEFRGEPVFGSSVAGTPGITHGYNRWIAWGTTNNLVDVTDTFAEQVRPDPASPSGLSTVYLGRLEPLIPIPQTFRANNLVDGTLVTIPAGGLIPPATLVMPRRDGGPIISLDLAKGTALSVQYVGFGATQEVEAFLLINRSRNLEDFKDALQRMDVAQNFVYADVHGHIAYFTSGEIPVREDLQAGAIGSPWLVRNGTGGHEWLPVTHRQPHQASAYEILPFSEMPQIVNPPAGYFVNGNNDPAGVTRDNKPLNQDRPGGGISYTAYSWNRGFRAARIETRLRELLESGDRRVSFEEMQAIQADVVVRDGEVLTPHIVRAFDRASAGPAADAQLVALAQDPGIAEAVARLRGWNGWTPSGLTEGYDEGDVPGVRQAPSASEVQASIAASIYAAWRSRMLSTVINGTLSAFAPLPAPDDMDSLAALRNLLDNFAAKQGVGVSGINFFAVPGVASAADRRDIIILTSLRAGLDLLAGPTFFGSPNQNNYRWGRLHRVVFAHPLGSPFSIPPAGGAFPGPLPGVSGFPTDGGFQTVDASTHNARGTAPDHFMYKDGPAHRTVVEARSGAMRAASIWPGGTSGVPFNPNYFQFLERYLSNETLTLRLGNDEVVRGRAVVEKYIPAGSD
jgi:penicillin G amidase